MKVDVSSYLKALSKCKLTKTRIDGLFLIKEETELLNVYSEFSRLLKDRKNLVDNIDGENDFVLPLVLPDNDGNLHLLLIVYYGPKHEETGYVGMYIHDFINRNIDYLNEYLGVSHVNDMETMVYEQLSEFANLNNKPPYQVAAGENFYGFLQENN